MRLPFMRYMSGNQALCPAFSCHRKLHPMTQKRSAKDRTVAEWKNVAKATRRRRRILQAGFFLMQC